MFQVSLYRTIYFTASVQVAKHFLYQRKTTLKFYITQEKIVSEITSMNLFYLFKKKNACLLPAFISFARMP